MRRQIIRAYRFWERTKAFLSLAQRRQNAIFFNLRLRFYDKFWQDAVKAIDALAEDTGYGYLKIKKNDHWTLVQKSDVMLDDSLTCQVTGDKPFIHRFLNERGYPTPRFLEFDLTTLDKAYVFLDELAGNAVVKPADGGYAGRGVSTRISTYKQLKAAAYRATAYCKRLLIEEEIRGHSYRLLFLDGEFLDAVKRDPPTVVGDGKTNIKDLIENENANRAKNMTITALSPLVVDLECKTTLQEQGLSLRDVPSNGQRIIVKYVVNQNNASENHVVRDSVHPSYKTIGKNILHHIGLKLGGLDVMTNEISSPADEADWKINEINARPGLHHHELLSDLSARAHVGEQILNYILTRKFLID